MFSFNVNVSIDGRHYFLIKDIDGQAKAENIARDMMDTYTQQGYNVRVRVLKWTRPLGEEVLDLN